VIYDATTNWQFGACQQSCSTSDDMGDHSVDILGISAVTQVNSAWTAIVEWVGALSTDYAPGQKAVCMKVRLLRLLEHWHGRLKALAVK